MKRIVLTVVLLMTTCALSASAQINYPSFSSVAGLNLAGSAGRVSNRLRLTPSSVWNSGAAWYSTKQPVRSGFVSLFQFQLTEGVGNGGGDGLAFVIQNYSPTALGEGGGWIGYSTSPNFYVANCAAVEFDTFYNAENADPNGNHVSLHSRGTLPNTPDASSLLGTTTGTIPSMKGGGVHTAKVWYTPGNLSVYLDNLSVPILTVGVDLGTLLDLDSGTAWVGFTAGTGGAIENHDILNWSFTSTNQSPGAEAKVNGEDEVTVELATADGTEVELDGLLSSDPDGDVVVYDWDFDSDGMFDASGVVVTHVYPLGTHTAALRVTDPDGETDTDTVTINVVDTTPPTIECPADVTVANDAGVCHATGVALGTPVTSDISGVAGVTNDAPTQFPAGDTSVTWTVTDNSGLTAVCTQTIKVVDGEAPVILHCAADRNVASNPYGQVVLPDLTVEVLAIDNCDSTLSITQSPAPGTVLAVGSHGVTFSVVDDYGNTSRCTAWVTAENNPPTACARVNGQHAITVELATAAGTQVLLAGWCSSDPDEERLTYDWDFDSDGIFDASGVVVTRVYPLGTHTATLKVTDRAGESDTDTVTINVVDTTPPEILSVTVTPSVLWSPNHKEVPIVVTVQAQDIGDAAPLASIVGITSNEPVNGLGDGDTAPDWEITGPLSAWVRAERSGTGSGRVYTLLIQCVDLSGNVSTATATVTAPRDQGKKNGK